MISRSSLHWPLSQLENPNSRSTSKWWPFALRNKTRHRFALVATSWVTKASATSNSAAPTATYSPGWRENKSFLNQIIWASIAPALPDILPRLLLPWRTWPIFVCTLSISSFWLILTLTLLSNLHCTSSRRSLMPCQMATISSQSFQSLRSIIRAKAMAVSPHKSWPMSLASSVHRKMPNYSANSSCTWHQTPVMTIVMAFFSQKALFINWEFRRTNKFWRKTVFLDSSCNCSSKSGIQCMVCGDWPNSHQQQTILFVWTSPLTNLVSTIELIGQNKCLIVTTHPNLLEARAWIDVNLEMLIQKSILMGIDPLSSLLPKQLDKLVYTKN